MLHLVLIPKNISAETNGGCVSSIEHKMLTENQIKAQEQKILGDLSELACIELLQQTFTGDVIDLNQLQNNFPLFDLAVKQQDRDLVFSVKARNKFTPKTNRLNTEYNLTTVKNSAKKLNSWGKAKNKFLLNTEYSDMYWIAIPHESNTWVPAYYGNFADLPACNTQDFFEGKNTYMRIKMKERYTQNYKLLGYVKIDTVNQIYKTKTCQTN